MPEVVINGRNFVLKDKFTIAMLRDMLKGLSVEQVTADQYLILLNKYTALMSNLTVEEVEALDIDTYTQLLEKCMEICPLLKYVNSISKFFTL